MEESLQNFISITQTEHYCTYGVLLFFKTNIIISINLEIKFILPGNNSVLNANIANGITLSTCMTVRFSESIFESEEHSYDMEYEQPKDDGQHVKVGDI